MKKYYLNKYYRKVSPIYLVMILTVFLSAAEAVSASSDKTIDFLNDLRSRLSLGGDLRLRAEETFNQDDIKDRFRGIFRFRLGATYKIIDSLDIGGRLASGATLDNGSPYATFDQWGAKKFFDLDRAYVHYHPFKQLSLWGGKFMSPFWQTDATWDSDIQPEGVASRLTFKKVAFLDALSLNAGGYLLNEISRGENSYMLGSQLIVEREILRHLYLKTGAGYFHFSNLNTETGANSAVSNSSTNSKAGTRFQSEFRVLDILGQISYRDTFPISVIFNYAKNYGAKVPEDELYWVGASIGKFKKWRNLKLSYTFSHIETDAAISDFNLDDLTLSSNIKGHLIAASVDLSKRVSLLLNNYLYQRDKLGTTKTTDQDPWVTRFRANVTVSF